MDDKKRPAETIRVGRVVASIWKNQPSQGDSFQSVTFERLYKRDSDTRWSYSSSFTGKDLLELAKAADLTHSALLQRNHEDKEEN